MSSDSTIFRPSLPTGTELVVIEGPVAASGYRWYHVRLVGLPLEGRATAGWIAMAARNGTPWIALSGADLAMSSAPRITVPASEATKAAAAINAFGVDLYRRLDKETGNVVVSPASIAIALAMARAGAKGETAAQMDSVLRSAGAARLADAINALDTALESRSGTFDVYGGTTGTVELRLANAIFAQRDLLIARAFLDALAARFGTGVRLVDYKRDSEATRRLINAWVNGQTRGRIPELLVSGDVDGLTRLAVVNALYLKAPWLNPFKVEDTRPRQFLRVDGSRVGVPMMQLVECQGTGACVFPYAAGAGWRAIELPFVGDSAVDGGGLAMTIIVPTDLIGFEQKLTPAVLARIVGSLRTSPPGQTGSEDPVVYDVELTMPRFAVDSRFDLASLLGLMGMPAAFDPATADFTGIATPQEGPLYIKKAIHQANIDVDEKGVVASAATALVMGAGGGPVYKHVVFKVDRPFLFLVRDVPTGTVLFIGRVTDPSK